jgi:hypothetical protein
LSAHEGDSSGREPARYVEPDASEARIQRLWSAVSDGLERPRTRSRRFVYALAAAGALSATALGAVSLWSSHDVAQSVWENAAFETASDALTVRLVDGSALKLDSRTRVDVKGTSPSAMRLKLERGRITCDVTHRPGRSFTVLAAGIEVRVVGTRFSVANEPGAGKQRVEVFVERGSVEVKTSDPERGVVKLGPGQSFAQVTEHGVVAREPAPAMPAPSTAVAPIVPAERRPTAAEATDGGARELLEEANAFRRSGDAQRAAQAYDELLRRFPGDGRAGLAAFELGRLRMDRLGDMSGAARALERAVLLAPGSGFREDAMARLVSAYAALGDSAGCSRARSRYLSSFPQGVHRQAVAGRCTTE